MDTIFPAHLKTAFTEGDCWVLAMSLYKKTGWKIVVVGVCEEDPVDEIADEQDWVHMAVRTPDGVIVDVNGLHFNEDEFVDEWSTTAQDRYCEPYAYLFEIEDLDQFDNLTREQGHQPLYTYDASEMVLVVDALQSLGSGQH